MNPVETKKSAVCSCNQKEESEGKSSKVEVSNKIRNNERIIK